MVFDSGFHLTVVFFGLLKNSMELRPVMSPAPNFESFQPPNENGSRGTGTPMPPTDPLLYRFYEMVMVNGPAWKVLIEEEFGDGIMSAIDFNIGIEREANERGDRVKITMSGKFLPYKYYGNEQGIPEYGYKEV